MSDDLRNAAEAETDHELRHQLRYRASTVGIPGFADVETPFWYCTCGKWQKRRDLPSRSSAERLHDKHKGSAAQ